MSGSRFFDRIAWSVTALTLVLTVLFMNGTALGMEVMARSMGYENRLFDHTKVHTIDIVMDEWDDFIANATSEEYYSANVVIDGEAYKNIGIRAKGNTSLSTVASLGSRRYSFKIEFDHYDSSKSYHGLDKLSLNNLIQDSTMMKDYLTYIMMNAFGVNSSLCSYVYITVNGEDWGLYLAVEGVEEAFLERNYGSDYGELYKPDSLSFGGGRGNGKAFEPPAEFDGSDGRKGGFNLGGGFGMGSSDVKLQYTDDDLDSYSNIWNNAKTDITEADQYRLIESLKKLSAGEEIESVVDIEQVIRYFVVHNYICNDDSYTGMMVHNYYLYEKDGQLAMIPWDYNLGFGTFTSGDATDTVNTPIDNPVSGGSSDRPMLNWIFENETYTGLYHEYFSAFIHTVDIEGIIEEAYHLIQSYVEKDPTAFYTYEEFETGLETLRRFCSLRSESISMQLESGETSENMNYADASAITLADMGSMEGGKGGFRGSMSGRPSGNTLIEAMSGKSSETMPIEAMSGRPSENTPIEAMSGGSSETMPSENMPPNMPDKFTETMQMPRENFTFDMNGADAPSSDLTGWIWMAFSAVILAAGLIVARKYKS